VDITYKILSKFDNYFRKIALKSHEESLGFDSFQYFSTPFGFFTKALDLIEEKEGSLRGKKFVDAGSGLGSICEFARQRGFNVEGIELNPVLCDLSKQIFPDIKVHNMNVMDFDKYNEFDVIFYWLPFYVEELRMGFRTKIENEIRVGSYIVVYEEEKQNIGKDDRFIPINLISNINGFENRVWQKLRD